MLERPLAAFAVVHLLALALALVAGGCADAPTAPAQDVLDGLADGVEPTPRDPDDLALKSGLGCHPRSAAGYAAGGSRAITVVDVDGLPVEINTAAMYLSMKSAAAADGVSLSVVSGFRTMDEQRYLYGCYVQCACNGCNLAAVPGYSNHQSGLALDLNTSDAGVYDWLARNGREYGFHRTVPSEDWHWEYLDGGDPGASLCESDLAFTGLRAGAAYRNGIWLKTRGSAHHVRYSADDIFMGASEDARNDFPVRVTVHYLGTKTFVAEGFDAEDRRISRAQVTVNVTAGDSPEARLRFVSPRDGGAYAGSLWMKVDAPATADRVVYSAGRFPLGESVAADQQFAVRANLTSGGWRVLQALAYAGPTVVGRAYTVFDAEIAPPSVRFRSVHDGGTYDRDMTLVVETSGPVATVEFSADQYPLGKVVVADGHARMTYHFQRAGRRVLSAVARDAAGARVDTATATVNVRN